VLAYIARTRSIGGDPSEGLRLATQALALAESLQDDELRAHTLATVGLAKSYLGDATGLQEEERALELAVAANSPIAGPIANNIAVRAYFDLDLRRARELFDEGRVIAERLGDASGTRWLRAQQISMAFQLGRWDDALSGAEEFIAECEGGSPHYLEGRTRLERGLIREARGDAEGAMADLSKALSLARSANDPQASMPVLGSVCVAFETRGLADEVRRIAHEMVELARTHAHTGAWAITDFLVSRIAHEYEPELRQALDETPDQPWKDLALACLDRDFVAAADIYARSGGVTAEALLRLRAAEELIESGLRAEGETQLQKALAFYRTVGASFYVERGEALLREAKSA
jgi:tetratricopeptide (TPR) repeat protein